MNKCALPKDKTIPATLLLCRALCKMAAGGTLEPGMGIAPREGQARTKSCPSPAALGARSPPWREAERHVIQKGHT